MSGGGWPLLKQHCAPHDLFNGDGNGPFLTLVLGSRVHGESNEWVDA